MSFADDLIKLRVKIKDIHDRSIIQSNEDKAFYEATLIQILNEAEKNRQLYSNQAENFRKQATMADGQASGFAAMSSIIINILNGYISLNDRQKEEDEMLLKEKNESKETSSLECIEEVKNTRKNKHKK